ncbi:MAG: DUF1573 domain-containing protein [Pirellulales bacterium]|nr:DUF1573 domain-containing protein [Pirellulales bacterium]
MKTIFLAVFAVILGIAIGVTTAWVRLSIKPWKGLPPVGRDGDLISPPASSVPAPRLEVDQAEYNFGSMDIEEKGSHEFLVRNRGTAPLTISQGNTSCRCAISKLERETLLPGESDKITLEYKPTAVPGAYHQTATFFTNDPLQSQFTLGVRGKITSVVRTVPAELIFSRTSSDEPTSGQVQVYCYRPEPLEIRGFHWSDKKLAGFFEAKISPLSREDLQEEKDARSGFLLAITLKPGLPQGPFQQKILLTTNLPARPEIAVPIRGKICTDISVVGPGWNDERNVLEIGTLQSREDYRRRLLLIVRGSQRKEVKFRVAEPVPEPLIIHLGKTVELRNGQVSQTPLSIEIPRNSRPVNHLGTDPKNWAKITLESTHSKIPQIYIFVQFAIGG